MCRCAMTVDQGPDDFYLDVGGLVLKARRKDRQGCCPSGPMESNLSLDIIVLKDICCHLCQALGKA